jgi:hypothetical protein
MRGVTTPLVEVVEMFARRAQLRDLVGAAAGALGQRAALVQLVELAVEALAVIVAASADLVVDQADLEIVLARDQVLASERAVADAVGLGAHLGHAGRRGLDLDLLLSPMAPVYLEPMQIQFGRDGPIVCHHVRNKLFGQVNVMMFDIVT